MLIFDFKIFFLITSVHAACDEGVSFEIFMDESKEKKKLVKNVYEIVQFKKLVGKKLVVPYDKGVDKKTMAETIKKYKEKISNGQVKNVILSCFLNKSGVLYVFSPLEKYYAVDQLSYAMIKNISCEVLITVFQYMHLSKTEMEALRNM